MNAVCLFCLHALEKTATAGFKTSESLSLLQLKAGTHEELAPETRSRVSTPTSRTRRFKTSELAARGTRELNDEITRLGHGN